MRSFLALTICTTLLAACSAQPSQEASAPAETAEPAASLDEMPAAFQGRWDFAEADCAAEASEMRLAVEAGRVAFYESSADLLTIRQTDPLNVTVTHSFSGEGEEWQETLGYQLSADGERLTVTTADGSFSTRVRCPG